VTGQEGDRRKGPPRGLGGGRRKGDRKGMMGGWQPHFLPPTAEAAVSRCCGVWELPYGGRREGGMEEGGGGGLRGREEWRKGVSHSGEGVARARSLCQLPWVAGTRSGSSLRLLLDSRRWMCRAEACSRGL